MLQQMMESDVRNALCRWQGELSRAATRLAVRLREGTVMVEYAIIAALVAIVAMAAVQALGTGIAGVFSRILSSIQGIG